MRAKLIPHVFFFVLLLLVTLAFLGLIRQFFQPLFWAAVLAVLFRPAFKRWLGAVGRPALASVLTILTILVILVLPLTLIGIAVSNEAMNVYARIASGELDVREPVRLFERALPVATDFLERFGVDIERVQENLSSAAVATSQFLASQALTLGQNALQVGVLFFIMLYLLFFFLRDGTRLIDALVRVLPLGDVRERRLFAKFAEVSRATLKGTLVVGVVQGALGGLFFWILGLGAPVFWGVIMTVLSLLPAVGSALVWVPAALILLVTGHIAKGIILIVAGSLLIGLVDNILRPVLVGRDTKMPDYLILLSTLGGLTVFGLSGFVIGPIIAALFLVLWEMFEEEYSGLDDEEAVREAFAHPETAPPPQPQTPEAAAELAAEGPPGEGERLIEALAGEPDPPDEVLSEDEAPPDDTTNDAAGDERPGSP